MREEHNILRIYQGGIEFSERLERHRRVGGGVHLVGVAEPLPQAVSTLRAAGMTSTKRFYISAVLARLPQLPEVRVLLRTLTLGFSPSLTSLEEDSYSRGGLFTSGGVISSLRGSSWGVISSPLRSSGAVASSSRGGAGDAASSARRSAGGVDSSPRCISVMTPPLVNLRLPDLR